MMVCTIAMARAVSVPGFGFSHFEEWIDVALKSGEMLTTSVPLYLASQKKWASGMRVTAGLAAQTSTHFDLYTAVMLSPGRL